MARPPEDAEASLEQQVESRLAKGNELFFGDSYQEALDQYLGAYNLVHRFLHPDVPLFPRAVVADRLRKLALGDELRAASVQVARFRHVMRAMPILSPQEPPAELAQVVADLGRTGTASGLSPAQTYYRQALGYLQAGAAGEARTFLERASRAHDDGDSALQAHLATAAAAVALQERDPKTAEKQLSAAQARYLKLGLEPERAAAGNNLGVLHTLNGDSKQAGEAFAEAGDVLPLDLGRTLQQPLNPGTASAMVRPMGSAGLSLVLRDVGESGRFVTAPANAPAEVAAGRLGVLVGEGVVDLDLAADPVKELTSKIFEPRRAATTLAELRIFEHLPGNLTAYLAHIRDFTLPLAIGDCHFEMGEFETALGWYEQARDYPYLNASIEAPVVWLKMAKAFLGWADSLYEQGDKVTATGRYEQIVRLADPKLDPASPLYLSPVFDGMQAAVSAILAAAGPLDPDVHNPAVAEVVLLARLNLENIAAGIDFPLLSLAREQLPVFTFEYLQNVARYFAGHAIEAERTYINFKTSAEQEQFQRSMLQNAVALETANEQLEAKKVEVAQAQRAAVDANAAYAHLQAQNARALRTEYASVSQRQAALDAEITYVGAPTTEYDFSGYGGYGIPDGTHRADEVLRTLTQRRSAISRQLELDNMDRHIGELDAAAVVADKQAVIADKQVDAANLERDIATLRRQQAQQQLALFNSEEFTPELWNRLANEMKAISAAYLQQAIVVAKLMEQAYEFEIGESVNVIKPSYTRNDLSGLLAGDFLLRDIDSFTVMRIVSAEKKQPMKEIVSLADRYPVQFLRSFQQSGRMEFRTDLGDTDRNYPGAYQQRIKRVEVAVEGLVGHGGIHGTLTNTGLCLTRVRDGGVKMRLLKPETLLLSSYRIGPDSVVFSSAGETLATFENSPVATSWILELRPSANDLIYSFVTDVKLVLYYESFYDPDLTQVVLEELAETEPLSGQRTVALRYELFDEFFTFQDTGEARFTLRETMLPFFQKEPEIRELTILVETDDGVSPAGLTATVTTADGTTATQATDADGALSTGAGAALDAFEGKPLLQEWTIAMPEAANQARFDAGFRWSQVRNVVLAVDYGFKRLPFPGEPRVLLRDRFDEDPLGAFDVVDDAAADQAKPSQWAHDAAAGRIEQRSGIFGEPDPAAPNGPRKPGTYLVRKANADVPVVQDLLLIGHLSSSGTAGGIGLVFRWKDADNFYFFLMDGTRTYRRIGKKVGGVFQDLDTPAVDLTQGYPADQDIAVKVRARGDDLRVFLDGSLVLNGRDGSLPDAGRVGLYAWSNPGARFDDLQIVEL